MSFFTIIIVILINNETSEHCLVTFYMFMIIISSSSGRSSRSSSSSSIIFILFYFFFLQSIQEGIVALKSLIGNLEETGNDLVKLSGPGAGSSSVEEQVRVCVERYELLQKQTEERGIKIGMTLAQEEDLQNRLDELLTLLERRKEDFANLKPISVQPDTIRKQIEELQVRY